MQNNVLGGSICISTKTLTDIYCFYGNDKRNRHYVKKIIEKEFGDEIIFVTISVNEPEVTLKAVAHTSGVLFHSNNKESILKQAARILDEDIDTYLKRKKDGHCLASNSQVNDIIPSTISSKCGLLTNLLKRSLGRRICLPDCRIHE